MKFIEPFAVLDVFVSGLAAVEVLKGGLVRFTHYVEQHERGEVVGVINSKIIIPMEALEEARCRSVLALAEQQQPRVRVVGH